MANPLQGWNIIPKSDLNDMVRDSYRMEMSFRERKRKACYEFYDRTEKVTDNRPRLRILQEIARKYDFSEECLMDWVRF